MKLNTISKLGATAATLALGIERLTRILGVPL